MRWRRRAWGVGEELLSDRAKVQPHGARVVAVEEKTAWMDLLYWDDKGRRAWMEVAVASAVAGT
eukprot:12933322-Prorocentrum_lima.AAC.1